ncbi:MAG: hypothetical protein GF364_07675 [Candidatus Lokiarchaeota archaeon]|nr:hypothetical protein [Candidatus Lokiarchaeota archaeon]
MSNHDNFDISTKSILNLSDEVKNKISLLFDEMNSIFHSIFLKGFINLKKSTINELKSFQSRILKLELNSFAFYVNEFIKSAERLLNFRDNQDGAIETDNTEVERDLEQLTQFFNYIIVYLRVYERVQTKSIVLSSMK